MAPDDKKPDALRIDVTTSLKNNWADKKYG